MIYTIEYIRKEAEQLLGSWNGKDEKFVDHAGELRSEADAMAAEELLSMLDSVEYMAKDLNL